MKKILVTLLLSIFALSFAAAGASITGSSITGSAIESGDGLSKVTIVIWAIVIIIVLFAIWLILRKRMSNNVSEVPMK